MSNKDSKQSRRKNKQCLTLTLTADVADVLKLINMNKNQKNNTTKFINTITNQTLNSQKPVMTEQDIDRLFNSKSNNKTQLKQQCKKMNLSKQKNFILGVKFLQLEDDWDKLLTGLPSHENFDQDKISHLFTRDNSKQQTQKDLTQQFKKNYLVGKVIGEGAYASVRVGIFKPLNKKIAIKIYEKNKIKEPQRKKTVKREIKILQLIHHPYIVSIFDVVETNNHLNIIMEYLPGISLNHYLKNQPGQKVNEKNCKKIIKALIEAIDYLHKKNIAHRDIKLQNVILDNELKPKLIDFGFSTCLQPEKKVKIFCGTPSYMAPEIVHKKQYIGEKVDIWAMGVLFFVILTGYFPFKGATDQQLYKKITNADYSKLEIPSKEALDLLAKMLQPLPQQRITADEILDHAWLNNSIGIKKVKKSQNSADIKKRTISSHKSKQQLKKRKFTQTYKQNIKVELRLQSPLKNINLSNNKKQFNHTYNWNNNKLLKTQNICLNKTKQSKTHTKVVDLLKLELKKRQQEKSRGKQKRI